MGKWEMHEARLMEWEAEVGILGRLINFLTFGWWTRCVLKYPRPRP
jgi:hypothetical protein